MPKDLRKMIFVVLAGVHNQKDILGPMDGSALGTSLGDCDGIRDGTSDGSLLGTSLGCSDGIRDGASLGDCDGSRDGTSDGDLLGTSLGETLGVREGTSDGEMDGASDGDSEGRSRHMGLSLVFSHTDMSSLQKQPDILGS